MHKHVLDHAEPPKGNALRQNLRLEKDAQPSDETLELQRRERARNEKVRLREFMRLAKERSD